MTHAAVISVILDDPAEVQSAFNQIVSDHNHLLWGRMGIPVDGGRTALISLTVVGALDDINSLTAQLNALSHVSVQTTVAGRAFTLGDPHHTE